jgi:DNA-binding NtrC family response regulator
MESKPKVLVVLGGRECECLQANLQELSQVVVASGLEEALGKLRSERYDAVFSAWELQGGTWSDFVSSLREQGIHVPAIVYYHCAGEAEWMKALDGGAFDLLAPPFDKYKLAVVLEHVMASRRGLAAVA